MCKGRPVSFRSCQKCERLGALGNREGRAGEDIVEECLEFLSSVEPRHLHSQDPGCSAGIPELLRVSILMPLKLWLLRGTGCGTVVMAQQFRALAALPEDPSLISSTHTLTQTYPKYT